MVVNYWISIHHPVKPNVYGICFMNLRVLTNLSKRSKKY